MRAPKHLTSFVLIAAALGLGAYAYLVDRGSVSEGERRQREGSVFPAWRSDDVARIELARGDARVVLERANDDAGDRSWFFRAPRADRADDASVDKLMTALDTARAIRNVAPDAKTGLASPRLRGTVGMGAVTYRFALGDDAVVPAGAAYFALDGAPPVVVGRELVAALLAPADTYRPRSIVPYLSIELAGLEVRGPTSLLAIERADDVSFRDRATKVRVSRSELDRVWSALAEMRAEAFPSDAEAAAAVATPAFTIAMTPNDAGKARGELVVGGACPGHPEDLVVVRRAPTPLAACVPKGVTSGLALGGAALVDRQLFAAHDDEITDVRLETVPRGPLLDLARKDSGWHERAPADRDLGAGEAEAASLLVAALARASGDDVRAASDARPFEAQHRIVLHRTEIAAPEIVELAAPSAGGDVLARRAFDGATLRLRPEVARTLVPRDVALRPRALWSPPIDGAAPLAFATACDGVVQRVVHDDRGFRFVTPPGYDVDNAGALAAVDALARAKADAWVADADDGTFGFDGPPCSLSLTVAGAAPGASREASIVFGREGEGGVYAHLGGEAQVFVAPKTLRDRARTWLVDRHAFSVPRDAITRITVAAGTGPALDVTDPAARDAIALLTAGAVTHLGPPRASELLAPPRVTIRVTYHTDNSPLPSPGEGSGVGPPRAAGERRITLGAATEVDGRPALFARVDAIDATFAIERDRLSAVLGGDAGAPSP